MNTGTKAELSAASATRARIRFGTWNAIVAPPKTPAAIVAKLNKAVNEVLRSPQAQDHFAKINLHSAGGTPAETKAFITKETDVWGGVIKDAHVEAH